MKFWVAEDEQFDPPQHPHFAEVTKSRSCENAPKMHRLANIFSKNFLECNWKFFDGRGLTV